MLPDVDLALGVFLPVQHHGLTHTVVFVTAVAFAVGATVEYGLHPPLERRWFDEWGDDVTRGALPVFVVLGLLPGGYSHLFVDMLPAPDLAPPAEPSWPPFEKPWPVDLIWYNAGG